MRTQKPGYKCKMLIAFNRTFRIESLIANDYAEYYLGKCRRGHQIIFIHKIWKCQMEFPLRIRFAKNKISDGQIDLIGYIIPPN